MVCLIIFWLSDASYEQINLQKYRSSLRTLLFFFTRGPDQGFASETGALEEMGKSTASINLTNGFGSELGLIELS